MATPKKSEEELLKPLSYYEAFPATVQIIVGPELQSWTLNKELVCDRSSFFQPAFKGGFKESAGVMTLEEEEPAIFGHLVQWMYRGTNDRRLLAVHEHTKLTYYKLYIMADRYGIESLRDAVLLQIEGGVYGPDFGKLASEEKIKCVYENTLPTTGKRVRNTLIGQEVFKFFSPRLQREPFELYQLMEANSDYSSNLFRAVCNHTQAGHGRCTLDCCSVHGYRQFRSLEGIYDTRFA